MAPLKKSYDCLIYGGGLSGLLAARICQKKNFDFLIVEPSERLGGRLLAWTVDNLHIPPHLNLYSANQMNQDAFHWLEQLLDQNFIDEKSSTYPSFHFKEGGFHPFTEFNEYSPLGLKYYNDFCFENEKIKLRLQPQDWLSELLKTLSESHYVTQSEITQLVSQDHQITSAEINGKYPVTFNQLIWAQPPSNILRHLSPELLGTHDIKKLKRPYDIFDSMILNLYHPQFEVPENFKELSLRSSLFCLYGSTSHDFEPILGKIDKNSSCWMTLIPTNQSPDHEFVTKIIKNMKRQIKRPFPQLFDSHSLEKIILSESSYGQIRLKELNSGFSKSLQNLYFASGLCSDQASGLSATLIRAKKLERSLSS